MNTAPPPRPVAPLPPDEQCRLIARYVFQTMLGQEVPPPLWPVLRLRVVTQADGTAAALFILNGLPYRVQRPPGRAGGSEGWMISCPSQPQATLRVQRFQDALLVLVGAIELRDPLPPPLPLVCVA